MGKEEKKFNIQLAAQLSGLSTHTIRAWEKRYQALEPNRTANGRRLYSTQDIERLIMLAQLTQIGTSISQIASLSDEELKSTYDKFTRNKSQQAVPAAGQISGENVREKLLEAVGTYRVDIISQLLSEARLSLEPRTFGLEILDPLIKEVQVRVAGGAFQDAQAQAMYAIAKFHAGNIIYSNFERTNKSPERIVITSMDKAKHAFPLMISALLCCHHRKHFYYLNANLPVLSIIEAYKATEANHLILGLPEKPEEEILPELDEVINAVALKGRVILLGELPRKITTARWKHTHLVHGHRELDAMLEGLA